MVEPLMWKPLLYYHYFSSENMTAYIRLCRQYESLLHMKPEENPFWREASTCIKNALWLDSYCYDWALKEKTGKKFSSGIVFAYPHEIDPGAARVCRKAPGRR